MTKLIQIIKARIFVDAELETAITDHFVLEHHEKNTFLIKENQYCKKLFFLEEGTVRTFHYHNEKDVTSWVYRPEQFFTSA